MPSPITRLITIACILAIPVGLIGAIVQPMAGAHKSSPPAVDPARLQQHVRKLSVDFYPRSFEQFDNLEASARYIEEQLKASGATVTVQQVKVQEATYRNIIARFGPKQGALMVVGAHYDSAGNPHHAGAAPGYSPASHTPGADDNASGVAGLLELARLLGRSPQTRPVELVAYTLEEPPHFRSNNMGSVWHARALAAAGREVRLMLSIEMIGYFSDRPGSQKYPLPGMKYLYSERGDFIALVGKFSDFGLTRSAKAAMAGATDLPVHSINGPRLIQGIDFSDHRSYWTQGYPALMVTDTAFLRNPHYHKAGDTHDKLDYVRMGKVVQSVYALTQQL